MTSEKEFEYRGKLKDVADVTEEYFLLIHKSYLINMEHGQVVLADVCGTGVDVVATRNL